MAVGGFFLLAIIVVVVGIVGGAVYAIAAYLRRQELSPEGDKLSAREDARRERPEHLNVESEQRARFFGSR